MRIFSKKTLAIVLTLAMLVSCMVFSFGADAVEENLMWENDFSNGTDTNWKAAYTNASDNKWYAKGTYNTAVFDETNQWMELNFIGSNSWLYMSGFAMFHKDTTHATAGEYGYHGGETSGTMINYGAFLPVKGTYKVSLKYKVESFSATEGAKADICVGFAARTNGFGWYGNAQRATFINDTNKGNYEIATTLSADTVDSDWHTVTVEIDQPQDIGMLMHVFARNNDNAGKNLDGTTILVDDIQVYEVVAPTTKAMWQNTFDKAKGSVGTVGVSNDGNWLGAYSAASGESDGNWISQQGELGIDATYDETNEAMKISFIGDDSWTAMGGFVLFHETATVDGDGYGNVGVGQTESSTMKNFGVFRPGQGTYTVSLDYKVTEFSDVEGAAVDICFGFARRGTWTWQSVNQTRDYFVNTASGVIAEAATVTASDKGADWRTVTVTIDQPYNDTTKGMLPNVFVRTSHNVTQKNLAGTTILIDNVKIYATDAAVDQSTNDREQYLFSGNAGTEQEPIPTNLHRHTTKTEDTGVYTSVRLGATYTAGDETGATIVLGGKEYEIVERGILIGEANKTINLDKYLWKSAKMSGFNDYWEGAASADGYDVTFTLRLANMSEAWFASSKTDAYQYRSYYKIKVPYVESDGTFSEMTVTTYGGVSESFTFAEYAAKFTKDEWFPNLTDAS